MTTTRRSALKFFAGSAVGVMLTPAPWHVIRDTALWSENWPGIPQPKAGPVTYQTTQCTLCPGGCGVKARCVAGRPVSLAGTQGGLCPLGVTGHHLPYHPRRLRSGPVDDARVAVEGALARGARPAVLDLRPGRPASAAYRKAMAARGGFYLAPPAPGVSVNLTAAKTVISLGVPLFEGWLPPQEVWKARDGFRLVQVEPDLSRTAALADEWMPECRDLAALGRKSEAPVLVIDSAMSAPIVGLNRDLGGWGKTIQPLGIAPSDEPPDASIGLLYIDESGPGPYLPWPEIAPKLAPNAIVVALTWWRDGYARQTHLALPTPVYPEPELLAPAPGVVDAVTFITGSPAPAGAGIAWPGAMCTVSTPLFTKLYQESGLLPPPPTPDALDLRRRA